MTCVITRMKYDARTISSSKSFSVHVRSNSFLFNTSIYDLVNAALCFSYSYVYLTTNTDEGTNPASLRVFDKSTVPWKVCRGKVVEKLVTALPVSSCSSCANSNRVVSAGSVFMMLPEFVCNRSLASLWLTLGRGAAAAGAATAST